MSEDVKYPEEIRMEAIERQLKGGRDPDGSY
jgi:hypothetical protein